uniref:Cid5 n=1 Tax=Drosophila seriema TaxID=271509 RepID=A0A2R4RM07_9MUSC|nr:Cid5 [Drosophila seriema]
MRRSALQNSDDSDSDLSIAFGAEGVPFCSTTRKQKNCKKQPQDPDAIIEMAENDIIEDYPPNPLMLPSTTTGVCPPEIACPPELECPPEQACPQEPVHSPELVCPSEPACPRRRKQTNPFRRAQRFKREVRQLQRTPNFMIPRLSFGRVVREIMLETSECEPHFRITIGALEALQTATEMFMTQRFQDSYMMTMHRQRVTLELRDMALMAFICKQHGLL